MTIKKLAAWAGIIGPVIFVLTFTVDGLLTPGYSAFSKFVSELSIGEYGCIQITNFILFGLLFTAFSFAIRVDFKEKTLPQIGPILLIILAVCYLLSGPFVTDPGTIFTEQKTVHGMIHGILGAIVFVLMPVNCFVLLKSFRRNSTWRPIIIPTRILGAVVVLAVILLTITSKVPAAHIAFSGWLGAIQRAAIIPFMFWLFLFAKRFKNNQLTNNH